MNKQTFITALIAALLGLESCSRDSNYEDKVEQVTVYVSAETGLFYNVPNTMPEEGMRILIEGEDHYICVAFNTIAGFTYEKGYEYELLSKLFDFLYFRINNEDVTFGIHKSVSGNNIPNFITSVSEASFICGFLKTECRHI